MKTVAVLLACGVTTALTIDMAGAQGAQSYPFEGIWAQTATADGCRIAGYVYNRAYVRSTSDDDDSCKVNKVESQPDLGRKTCSSSLLHPPRSWNLQQTRGGSIGVSPGNEQASRLCY